MENGPLPGFIDKGSVFRYNKNVMEGCPSG